VTLLDLDSLPIVYTLTDAAGYFLVTAPHAGGFRVSAESRFYRSYSDGPVSLPSGDTLAVRFTLVPHPVELDELVVEAGRRYRRMARGGYFEREESGLGWHLNREEIERRARFRISEALRPVPWVRLKWEGFGEWEPVFRGARNPTPIGPDGTCYPRVFIDGILFSPGGPLPARIDRVLRPEMVEAIEVFEPPWVPAQFHGSRSPCGVIAIWRR
jgi:hypothetical protein